MHYLSCASHRLDCKIKLLLDLTPQKLTWLARTIWFIDNVASIPETQILIILEKNEKELPEDPVDGGDGGDGGRVAHPLGEQLLPDLPGKHPWKTWS